MVRRQDACHLEQVATLTDTSIRRPTGGVFVLRDSWQTASTPYQR
jgi:hypothetical protein